ncbi:MAG: hypothetical protein ABFS08_09085 [Pseudomonadota bacterium]
MLGDDVVEVVGSKLGARVSELRHRFDELTRHVDAILANSNIPLYQQHNVYTAYSILVLSYATAHRPVHDMFCFREDVCLSAGMLSINDKVSSGSTETRIIWLCDSAKRQFRNYLNHLNQLSIHLDHINEEVSEKIAAVIEPVKAERQVIPLFFYLSTDYRVVRARPGSLVTQLGYEWPFPFNHNRHFMETGLSEEGVDVPLIDLMLGHQSEYYHFLGKNTSWSASEAGDLIRPSIESLLNKSGITPLGGLRTEHNEKISPNRESPKALYGYLRRQDIRRKKLKKLEGIIKPYIHEEIAKAGGLAAYLSDSKREDESLKTLIDYEVPKGYPTKEAISIALNLLSELSNEMPDLEYSPKRLMVAEPSPFEAGWLSKYRTAKNVRDRFIARTVEAYDRERNESVEGAWAYIVFSAIATTGLHKKEWVEYVLNEGPAGLSKIKKWVYFIDIWTKTQKPKKNSEYQAPDWRWHPDSFSKAMILNLLQRFSMQEIRRYSSKKAGEQLDKLISSIGIEAKRTKYLEKACSIFKPFWRYHFPQYISDIFRGVQMNVPLPQRSLARLLYGTKLPVRVQSKAASDRGALTLPSFEGDIVDELGYLTLTNRLLNRAEVIKGASASDSNDKRREFLSEEVYQLYEQSRFSGVTLQLSIWLIHMCNKGVTEEKKPAISTIRKYFGWISKPLILLMYGKDLDDISAENISRIFKTVVNYKGESKKNDKDTRSDILRELINFHQSITAYGTANIDELDWEYIAEGVSHSGLPRPNSNVVTPEEYSHCLTLVSKKMVGFDAYQRTWPALFLIIGYRFGLRLGEIRRLRKQDVQVYKGMLLIQIQNTREGRAKTKSSVRQSPMIGELTPQEIDFVNAHLSVMSEKHGLNPNSPLFTGFGTEDGLLDMNLIRTNVHALLKYVTGDTRIVFHHLRHSFISLQYLINFMPIGYRVKSQVRGKLFESASDPCKILIGSGVQRIYRQHALSRYVGHKDVSTTVHSYLHFVDDIASAYAEMTPVPNLKLSEISKISGMKESTLRNRLRNNKEIDVKSYKPMDVLRTIQIREEIKKYQYKLAKFTYGFEFAHPKRLEVLVSWHRALLEHGAMGDSIEAAGYLYCIDAETMQKVVSIAQRVNIETYFGGYFHSSNSHGRRLKSLNERYAHDLDLVISSVEELYSGEASRKILLRAVGVWMRCYRKDEKGECLVITNKEDLKSILDLAESIGIGSDSFVAEKHERFFELCSEMEYDERMSLADAIELGVKSVRKAIIRTMDRGEGIVRYDFLRLSTKRLEGIRNHTKSIKTLSYALHMAAVLEECA